MKEKTFKFHRNNEAMNFVYGNMQQKSTLFVGHPWAVWQNKNGEETKNHHQNLPTMVAKIKTPAKKSATTNKYSTSFSGVGVSPIVVNVNVDQ